MAYSTSTQLKANVKAIEASITATNVDAFCTERIAFADQIVLVDLTGYVTMTGVDNTVPVVNLLGQYKAAEMSHVRLGSVKRNEGDSKDAEYWHDLYEALLARVKSGNVIVYTAAGVNISTSKNKFSVSTRADVTPGFGYGKYGEWIDDEDLSDQREEIDDTGN